MKIKNLIAVAALLLGSTGAFAQTASGLFTISVAGTDATITGFRADVPASDQANVTVPATLTNDGGDDYNVVAIGEGAFKSNANLKTISIAASVTQIEADAFNDCSQLTTITFVENSNLAKLGDYAFGSTPGLTKIDFTNCAKMKDFSAANAIKLSTAVGAVGQPFVTSAATPTNYQLKEIVFNGETTDVGIALAGLKGLTTVNLSATKITALANGSLANTDALTTLVLGADCKTIGATGAAALTSLTINCKNVILGATSFTMAANSNSTITFGEIDGAAITANAIVGPTGFGKAATLVLGDIKSALSSCIVTNNVATATTGKIGAAVKADVFGNAVTLNIGEILAAGSIGATGLAAANTNLTTVNFTGDIDGAASVAGTAFIYYTKLATVTFTGKIKTAGAIDAAAFGNATSKAGSAADAVFGIRMTVTYLPADDDVLAASPFDALAFAETGYEGGGGAKEVKLVTTRKQGLKLPATFERVSPEFAAEEVTIKVAKKDGKYWYGTYFNNASLLKIAKQQNGDKVMVYGAYVDQSDNTIYMDQLRAINGYYFVPANVPVVVKSNTADDVKAIAPTALDAGTYTATGSMNLASATNYQNEICVSQAGDNTAAKIMNKTTDLDWSIVAGAAGPVDNNASAIFFLYPAASFNFYWNSIVATGSIPEGTFYIRVNKALIAAGARVNVVWNDGSEEATAIQTVKKVAEANGAIYNLAGQKVNASYKGVVIKDGKKYIQK